MIYPAVLLIAILGWSLTNILVNGSILDQIRNYLIVKSPFFSKLLTCMQCSGFWVGILFGLLTKYGILYNIFFYVVVGQDPIILTTLTVFLYGVFISGVSVLINSILVFLHSFNRNRDSVDI